MIPQEGDEWGLPEMVQQYHSLCPLEDLTSAREKSSQAFGIKTALLKGVSSRDGQAYTLRRIDNRRVRRIAVLPFLWPALFPDIPMHVRCVSNPASPSLLADSF